MMLILIILSLLTISSVSASEMANDTTSDLILSENNKILTSNSDGTFTDLASEIASATGELNLTRNYVYSDDDSDYVAGINITQQLTINGNGFIIDGSHQARAFNIGAPSVMLTDISFVNCYTWFEHGGAILWKADSGTLVNCTFFNNTATKDGGFQAVNGGAVYYYGDYFTVDNCNFINNSAHTYGGALLFNGDWNNVTNCSFSGNNVGYNGAAIYLMGENSKLAGSRFYDNKANNGGALYLLSENCYLANCSFVGNNASGYGGAVYWGSTGGTLIGCNFSHNNVSAGEGGAVYWRYNNGYLANCSFADNYALNDGGAVSGYADNCKLVYCNFSGNSAKRGGAVSWTGDNFILDNCVFTSNYAVNNGGAVFMTRYDGVLSNCNFTDNKADKNGGAVYSEAQRSHIVNCTFSSNIAAASGGALRVSGTNNTLTDSSFFNNNADDGDGSGGAVDWQLSDNGYMDNCFFTGNVAYTGGAVNWDAFNGTLTNCNFSYNVAVRGGAVCLQKDADILINCSFADNEAKYGGAVMWYGVNGTLANCNFSDNAAEKGGAVYWSEANGKLVGCSFNGNNASDKGGAVYWLGDYATLADSSFNGNNADERGGAVFWEFKRDSTLTNCSFIGNGAEKNGGAFSFEGTRCNFADCNFTGNVAEDNGGAVHWMGTDSNLVNCNFIANKATCGAGVYWIGNRNNLFDCNFSGNVAYSGGAIYLDGDDDNMTNCKFSANNASVNGGAVYCYYGSNCYLVNCSLYDNKADNGGAVYWSSVKGSLIDCSFEANTALEDGGAVHFSGDNCNVFDCNFTDNKAVRGGAIFWNAINGVAVNCILSDNVAIRGGAVYLIQLCNFSNCIFYDNKAESDAIVHADEDGLVILTFSGFENFINAIFSELNAIDFINVTYYNGEMVNSDVFYPIESTNESGVSIIINVYSGESLIDTAILKTDGEGKAIYDYLSLKNNGNYTFIAYHPDDAYYTYINTTGNFTVLKSDLNLNVSVENIVGGKNATVNITLNDDARGNLSVTVGGFTDVIVLSDEVKGNVLYDVANLDAGDYNVTVVYSGDRKYLNQTAMAEFKVEFASTNLTADVSVWYYYRDVNIPVVLTSADGIPISGEKVIMNIENENITLNTDSNGMAIFSLPDLSLGNHTATVHYDGNGMYNSSIITVIISVKANTSISTVYDNIAKELTVTLINNATGVGIGDADIVIGIGGGNYTVKTNSTGQAVFSTGDLDWGTYVADVSYSGSAIYNPSNLTVEVPVKANTNISAVYNNDTRELIVTLINNGTGQPLKGAYVIVKVNGVSHKIKTDSKGRAVLSGDDLPLGTYVAVISYKGSDKYYPANTSLEIVVKDDSSISAVYDDGAKELVVCLFDEFNGKPLKGANVIVKIDGKSYKVDIDATGQGILSLADLAPGNYTADIVYRGSARYNSNSTAVDVIVK